MDRRFSFWIDRGGTFTDVIATAEDGEVITLKLLSSSPAYPDAAVEAMRRVLDAPRPLPFPAHRVSAIRMGTTVATNALLERTGARTVFITSEGLADLLLIGDQSRPELFALDIVRPAPLYERVIEAAGRLDAAGRQVRPLKPARLLADLELARSQGLVSCAIALMHADLNPDHELQAAELARQAGFDWISLSHEVSPLPRLVPRAQTTVADAYLTPVVRAYVEQMEAELGGAPLAFMTSAGGLVAASAFRGRDAVLSGPAGGVVGVAATAARAGISHALGFDMGGTSTDVCRVSGQLHRREAAKVAGVSVRTPMLDVETVAAGGGSILAFDGLRARVGPESAGAAPGPAAYGRGGPATLTDANLVLGRLWPAAFPAIFGPDGHTPIDTEAAEARLSELADAMGAAEACAAAEGFAAIAVEQMAQAVRRISSEQGFDPRDHALVAFGGAAGQLACDVAQALGVREVVCPLYGSLLSAWGIGQAKPGLLRQAGLEAPLDEEGVVSARRALERLSHAARQDLAAQGVSPGPARLKLRLRYEGADADIVVPLSTYARLRADFEAAHARTFGFIEPSRPILISAVEAEVEEADKGQEQPGPAALGWQGGQATGITSLFRKGERLPAPVLAARPGLRLEGPALILRPDTQITVLPGWRAQVEGDGLVRLCSLGQAAGDAPGEDRPDPVTLELFNRRFMGIAEAMGAALERTAHSVNIKERLDFSCALFDAEGGLVANAPHMPVHLGSMGASVRAVRSAQPRLRPNEAYALNNPYAGGTHLPDVTVVTPVFLGDGAEPDFYVAARGHHADIGGIQPGSMPPFSRTLAEEGVILDCLQIMGEGRFLEDAVRSALTQGPWPARAPERNLADLKAQLSACQAGAEAVMALITEHGAQTVRRYMGFVQDNAEACVRRTIGQLQNGEASSDLDAGARIHVNVRLGAAGEDAVLDFTGSGDQVQTNFNAPRAIVEAAALYVFRTLVRDDIPLNAGCLKPLGILTRRGSVLDPEPPAAVVAGNVETSQHVVDALYEALGVLANSQGTMNNFTFGDEDNQYYETICGGAGASAWADGADAVQTHMTNSRLTDPEILERRFAVRLERFALRPGSGGAGERRGGDGVVRTIRFLAPMQAALLASRRSNPPRGLKGGRPGAPGRQRLIRADGAVMELPGCFAVTVQPGDMVEIETPGGGGYGPVREANP